MILFPRIFTVADIPTQPAWQVVETAQRLPAENWWLIAQPDHAALAADLASRIRSSLFPSLDADVLAAIALHDEGWRAFDAEPVVRNDRPLSFIEMPAADFLQAWRESIDR